MYAYLVCICAAREIVCVHVFVFVYAVRMNMCVFILVIGMLFSFSNFLYPYGHQICFDEKILSVWSYIFFFNQCVNVDGRQNVYPCKRAIYVFVCVKAPNLYSFISSILIFLFNSLFTASINTYWSVYSRNKIHLTSNKCRSIPGLNDFSENLASY